MRKITHLDGRKLLPPTQQGEDYLTLTCDNENGKILQIGDPATTPEILLPGNVGIFWKKGLGQMNGWKVVGGVLRKDVAVAFHLLT